MKKLGSLNRTIFIITAILVTQGAYAETGYVIDQLRVGVRAEPDTSLVPTHVVVTGMELNILDRTNDYVKVETESGKQGWVKSMYITDTPPAMLKLKQLTVEHTTVVESFETAKSNVEKLDEQVDTLTSENKILKNNVAELEKTLSQLKPDTPADVLFERIAWVALVIVVMLLAFVSGMGLQRQRTLKKLGGFRL